MLEPAVSSTLWGTGAFERLLAATTDCLISCTSHGSSQKWLNKDLNSMFLLHTLQGSLLSTHISEHREVNRTSKRT